MRLAINIVFLCLIAILFGLQFELTGVKNTVVGRTPEGFHATTAVAWCRDLQRAGHLSGYDCGDARRVAREVWAKGDQDD